MADIMVTGTDSLVTQGGAAFRGFFAYEEVYIKSVADAIEALHGFDPSFRGEGAPVPITLRSSDEPLLQFIASRIYCPLLDNRRILVPSDAQVERLSTVQKLELTASAYLDYDEIQAYIEGNRPEWVCFECASQSRALTFVRYFRQFKASPMIYVMRDSLCIYVRNKSDAYEYDELTPDSLSLITQMGDGAGMILHEYTKSVLAAKRERMKPDSYVGGGQE